MKSIKKALVYATHYTETEKIKATFGIKLAIRYPSRLRNQTELSSGDFQLVIHLFIRSICERQSLACNLLSFTAESKLESSHRYQERIHFSENTLKSYWFQARFVTENKKSL